MERKALQRSMSKSSSSRRKPKRAPSLLFRQAATKDEHEHERPEEQGSMVHVPLSDGRVISFDPARIEAGRIDAELAQGGLGDEEKRKVKTRVQEEVVRALTARVAEWNALKD
jgi:hypothetical protein